jgi:hypothetical protein
MLGSGNIRPAPGHFRFLRKANRLSMQLRTLSPCTQNSTAAAATWDIYAVLTPPPLPPARVAHVVSPAVLSASKFARKALATSKEDVQVHWLGGRLCFGGG